jgi:hypothetical protein
MDDDSRDSMDTEGSTYTDDDSNPKWSQWIRRNIPPAERNGIEGYLSPEDIESDEFDEDDNDEFPDDYPFYGCSKHEWNPSEIDPTWRTCTKCKATEPNEEEQHQHRGIERNPPKPDNKRKENKGKATPIPLEDIPKVSHATKAPLEDPKPTNKEEGGMERSCHSVPILLDEEANEIAEDLNDSELYTNAVTRNQTKRIQGKIKDTKGKQPESKTHSNSDVSTLNLEEEGSLPNPTEPIPIRDSADSMNSEYETAPQEQEKEWNQWWSKHLHETWIDPKFCNEELHQAIKADEFINKFNKRPLPTPFHRGPCGICSWYMPNGINALPRRRYIPDTGSPYGPIRNELIKEAHQVHLHRGAEKTYKYLRDRFYWPGMCEQVTEYCRNCNLCQIYKRTTQLPPGEARMLSIPERHWQSVAIDFMGPLPTSKNKTHIMVIMDRLSGAIKLIALGAKATATECANAFIQKTYADTGLPNEIVSDRDSRFTSKFWQQVTASLGINLLMTTAFHQNTNGQVERAIQTIKQALAIHIAEDPEFERNWSLELWRLEAAVNHSTNKHTNLPPSTMVYGFAATQLPDVYIEPTEIPSADRFIEQQTTAQAKMRDALIAARFRETARAQKRRNPKVQFKIGDLVLYKREKTMGKKLQPQWKGPFQIEDINTLTGNCKLQFDTTSQPILKRVHPWFATDRLKLYHGQEPTIYNTEPDEEELEEEYEIEKIISHKWIEEPNGDRREYYLVKWDGYPDEENTWEPVEHLTNAPEAIKAFHDAQDDTYGIIGRGDSTSMAMGRAMWTPRKRTLDEITEGPYTSCRNKLYHDYVNDWFLPSDQGTEDEDTLLLDLY